MKEVTRYLKQNWLWKFENLRAQSDSWNAKLPGIVNDFCLFQNVTDHTRLRGAYRPSMLDLIFRRHKNYIKDMENCPLGKSKYVIIKLKFSVMQEIPSNINTGKYKNIYFFKGINWETFLDEKNVDIQHSSFCGL